MRGFRLLVSSLGLFLLLGCDEPETSQARAGETVQPQSPPPLTVVAPESIRTAEPETVTWLDDDDNAKAEEIEWDDLIPADWRPEKLFEDYDAENLSDDDPRAQELLEKLKTLWSEAPVVPDLADRRVKLAGFVVPLEMDDKQINQFLLVPYYGACIHVPPPPANQTIFVITEKGKGYNGQLFDVVWVTGTMRVERLTSELGEAGYRLEHASVAPYQ